MYKLKDKNKKIIISGNNIYGVIAMLMQDGLRDIIEGQDRAFNIIEEFSQLTPRRKVLLCDHLFTEGRQAFYNTVEILWPDASGDDAKRLEKFLFSLKNRSH